MKFKPKGKITANVQMLLRSKSTDFSLPDLTIVERQLRRMWKNIHQDQSVKETLQNALLKEWSLVISNAQNRAESKQEKNSYPHRKKKKR